MQRQGLESTFLSICNELNKVLKLWYTDKPLLLYRCGYSQLIFIQMENLKCINCENHAKFDMKCNINSENYNKGNDKIKDCFILSDWLKSLDKAIDATDKLIEKLS